MIILLILFFHIIFIQCKNILSTVGHKWSTNIAINAYVISPRIQAVYGLWYSDWSIMDPSKYQSPFTALIPGLVRENTELVALKKPLRSTILEEIGSNAWNGVNPKVPHWDGLICILYVHEYNYSVLIGFHVMDVRSIVTRDVKS